MTTSSMSKRTCPGDLEYGSWVMSLKPEVIVENTSRRTSELEVRTTRHGRSSHRHYSSLHFILSSSSDAGKYAVPPQIGNVYSLSLTTPVNYRLVLESDQHVSPTGQGPLNQEENVRCLCPKLSKRGGTPH